MLNVYKYYDHPDTLLGFESYKRKIISGGDIYEMLTFAKETGNRRFEEAEPYIMRSPYAAYIYALEIIKGRWSEAEPYIMKDAAYASHYAKHVIKSRWEEAEPYIKRDRGWWNSYRETFGIE